ncbi:MAG: TonB-dependent receptor, partial [Proteobacteria bacterium]
DLQSGYRWELAGGSRLRANLTATYYTRYDTQQTPTAPLLERVGVLGNPLEVRGRASFGWNYAGFDASVAVSHSDDYLDITVTPNRKVDAYTTADVTLGYRFADERGGWFDGVALNVNVQNVFDQDPPFVNSTAGFDSTQASPYGRFTSASITKRW